MDNWKNTRRKKNTLRDNQDKELKKGLVALTAQYKTPSTPPRVGGA